MQIAKTIKASFNLLLFLNNISIPNPAFTNHPDSKAPKGSAPCMYKVDRRTLEAQFGISPTNVASNGDKAKLERRKLDILSSPT